MHYSMYIIVLILICIHTHLIIQNIIQIFSKRNNVAKTKQTKKKPKNNYLLFFKQNGIYVLFSKLKHAYFLRVFLKNIILSICFQNVYKTVLITYNKNIYFISGCVKIIRDRSKSFKGGWLGHYYYFYYF